MGHGGVGGGEVWKGWWVYGQVGGWASGWAVTCSGGRGPSHSPVGEAVGRGHHPAGVDKTPCTEVAPDVDGGQPGVGAGQGR